MSGNHRTHTTASGATILVAERPTSGTIALAVAIKSGARDEGPGEEGLRNIVTRAHLLGTEKYVDEDSLRRAVSVTGGGIGASTTRELTQLSITVPAGELDLALDVLDQVLNAPLFEQSALDRDRKLVLQEISRRQAEPGAVAIDTLTGAVWNGHPAGHSPLGTAESIVGFSRDTLLACRTSAFTSANTTIAIAGEIEGEWVIPALETILNKMPVGSLVTRENMSVEFPQGQPVIEREVGQRQAQVLIGVPIPGRTNPDRYALYVIDAILGSPSGRLFAEVRTARGLAYSAGSSLSLLSDTGVFYGSAGTSPENVDQVRGLIEEAFLKLVNEPIDAETLQAAIGQLAGRRIMADETSGAQASQLAVLTSLGTYESARDFAQSVSKVTVEDVQRVAAASFGNGKWTVLVRPLSELPEVG